MANPLVGKHFLSFIEDADGDPVVQLQGEIVAEPQPGVFLVQLFEWITGSPSDQRLFKVDAMTDWRFYETAEQRNDAYERQTGRSVD
jgi:hypothetical protein